MSIPSKLTMSCKITPVTGQDTAGDKTYGGQVTGVKCFAFGNTRRFRNQEMTEYIPDFRILFLPGADVGQEYLIDDIFNHKDELVLKKGVINNIEQNFHPKKGLVLKSGYVSKR